MIRLLFLIYYESILKLKVYNINNDSSKLKRSKRNFRDNNERY